MARTSLKPVSAASTTSTVLATSPSSTVVSLSSQRTDDTPLKAYRFRPVRRLHPGNAPETKHRERLLHWQLHLLQREWHDGNTRPRQPDIMRLVKELRYTKTYKQVQDWFSTQRKRERRELERDIHRESDTGDELSWADQESNSPLVHGAPRKLCNKEVSWLNDIYDFYNQRSDHCSHDTYWTWPCK